MGGTQGGGGHPIYPVTETWLARMVSDSLSDGKVSPIQRALQEEVKEEGQKSKSVQAF